MTGLAIFCAGMAAAQDVVIPGDRTTQIESGCKVTGLDPNGDGFLAMRAGPGTEYAQIDSLHNGDAAYIAAGRRGRWLYVENGSKDGREAKFRGWIYDAWCTIYP